MQDWQRSPGAGKYARLELERRFLVVGRLPDDVAPWLIEDRYVDATTLRLRRLTAEGETVCKLTQKVRPDPDDPSAVSITNVYLTGEEYDLLAGLPAAVITKTRRVCVADGVRFAVDIFDGELAGLRLAEVEVGDLAAPLPRPVWLGSEVTRDDRYSGGRLARMVSSQLAALLQGTLG